MANTSSHPWTVNGVRLDTWAHNIKNKAGWVSVPVKRGTNVIVPGRNGSLYVPAKKVEPGQVNLQMWVSHLNADGAMVGTDKYANWRHNLDTLIAIFDDSFGQLDVRQQISPTDIRQAFCEVKAIVDPEMFGDLYGSLNIGLDIAGSWWQDVAYTAWSSPTGVTAVGTHDLVDLAGGTAPMEDGQFVVDGPINNPQIIDDKTGHTLQLVGTAVPDGQQWMVDCATWTSKIGAAIEWTAGGVSVTEATVASGFFAPRLMGLAHGLLPRVRLAGTGAGANTRLRGRHRRKFK